MQQFQYMHNKGVSCAFDADGFFFLISTDSLVLSSLTDFLFISENNECMEIRNSSHLNIDLINVISTFEIKL